MSFRLYPVPQSKLDVLLPLLEEVVKARPDEKRDALTMLSILDNGYSNKLMAAYTDSITEPKCLLTFLDYPSFWNGSPVTQVTILYTTPDMRGNSENNKIIANTIDSYAKLRGSVLVCGTSRCGDSAENFWKKSGFLAKETLFVKAV